MGVLFSVLLLITFGFVFNAVHANSVSQAVSGHMAVSPLFVGLVIAGVTAFIVFRGIHSIVRFAELVVPVMALAYLLIAFGVVCFRFDEIPAVITLIFENAFGLHSAAGGAIGYSVAQAMMQGSNAVSFPMKLVWAVVPTPQRRQHPSRITRRPRALYPWSVFLSIRL